MILSKGACPFRTQYVLFSSLKYGDVFMRKNFKSTILMKTKPIKGIMPSLLSGNKVVSYNAVTCAQGAPAVVEDTELVIPIMATTVVYIPEASEEAVK